ncbi:hypothetical protein GCM10027174_03570 [Salinifilum aidingensis]
MTYRPHPFSWCPGGGARHATTSHRPQTGTEVTALCGSAVTADHSDVAWLWPTCAECNAAAHDMVGTPKARRSG